jgi:hypothetical protein
MSTEITQYRMYEMRKNFKELTDVQKGLFDDLIQLGEDLCCEVESLEQQLEDAKKYKFSKCNGMVS